jgi:hypothetical protein
MVTLVVNMLRVSPGAAVTVMGWTLGVVDCGTAVETVAALAPSGVPAVFVLLAGVAAPVEVAAVLLPPPPPPPPPQPVNAIQIIRNTWSWIEVFMAS